jgi:hypothetical protein
MLGFNQVQGTLVNEVIRIPLLSKEHDRYVRRRWSKWWQASLQEWAALDPVDRKTPAYAFAKALAAASGSAANAKGFAARIKDWASGKQRPTAKTAFQVGQVLRSSGLKTANGIVAIYAAGYYPEVVDVFAQLAVDDRGRGVVATFIATLPLMLSRLDFDVDVEGIDPSREQRRMEKILDAYGRQSVAKLDEAMEAVGLGTRWPTNAFESAILRSAKSAAHEVVAVNPQVAAHLCWLLLAEWVRMVRPAEIALNPDFVPRSNIDPQWGTLAGLLDPYFEAQRADLYTGDAISRRLVASHEYRKTISVEGRARREKPKPKNERYQSI